MARPRTLKCSDKELKEYLLNFFVNDKGKRRSVRDLVINEDFIKFSGLEPSKAKTTGTMTYHMKRLNINEKTIYEFGMKTGRIPCSMRFEDFQLCKEKKGKPLSSILDENDLTLTATKKWRKVAKELGIEYNIDGLGLDGFKELCYLMGFSDNDLESMYKLVN